MRHTLPAMVRYLRREKPDFLLTAHRHKNILAVWAGIIARVETNHIASLHSSIDVCVDSKIVNYLMPFLYRVFLRNADCVVVVSNGIFDEIRERSIAVRKIRVIQNGAIPRNFDCLLQQEFEHPWLIEPRPFRTFVAAGRLDRNKDFSTLIMAFSDFLKCEDGKLIIFGEGPERLELENLAKRLNVTEHIHMPGFVSNIFPAMRKSSAFILSSIFEGFGLVVAEALACGSPVISTDCPYGPSEILNHGEYGLLVPIGDWKQLSYAMQNSSILCSKKATLRKEVDFFRLSVVPKHICHYF